MASKGRGMRTFTTAVIICLLLGVSEAQDLSRRDIQNHLREYVATGTSEERRAEVLKALRGVSPATLSPSLGRMVRDEDQRARALELATVLRVGGLYGIVRREREGPDEEAILRYGLTLEERHADSDVYERWLSLEASDRSFAVVDDLLRTLPVPFSTIDQIRRWAVAHDSDNPKWSSAEMVLQFQLGVPSTLGEITSDWRVVAAEYHRSAQVFPTRGTSMLGTERHATGTIYRVGHNRRLAERAVMIWSLEDVGDGESMTISFRILVDSKTSPRIMIKASGGEWNAYLKDGEWYMHDENDTRYALTAQFGQWSEFEITATPAGARHRADNAAGDARVLSVKVNGRALLGAGRIGGDLKEFMIQNETESGTILLAALGRE